MRGVNFLFLVLKVLSHLIFRCLFFLMCFFFFLPLWWKCWFPVFQIPSPSLALCDPGSGLRCGTCTNTHMPAHTHIPEHSSSCPRSSSLRTQTRDLSSGSRPKFEFTRFPRCRGKRKGAGPTVFATVSADCKC